MRDDGPDPQENFISEKPSSWYANRFREDDLQGGHVIKLGPGNDNAAREALSSWPGGLQIGGGITPDNATDWLEAGASHVIVTSALFDQNGKFLPHVLESFGNVVGEQRLVIDLSCRKSGNGWIVAMNRWQTPTEMTVDHATLDRLAPYCAEFLIHAADVEGLCRGIDADLVTLLGTWGKIPVTYAGGAASLGDVELLESASNGKVDITVGSALDIFGGSGVTYAELVEWNHRTA